MSKVILRIPNQDDLSYNLPEYRAFPVLEKIANFILNLLEEPDNRGGAPALDRGLYDNMPQ